MTGFVPFKPRAFCAVRSYDIPLFYEKFLDISLLNFVTSFLNFSDFSKFQSPIVLMTQCDYPIDDQLRALQAKGAIAVLVRSFADGVLRGQQTLHIPRFGDNTWDIKVFIFSIIYFSIERFCRLPRQSLAE